MNPWKSLVLLSCTAAPAMAYPFGAVQLVRKNESPYNHRLLAVADFDRDGKADVVSGIIDQLFFMRSTGNGNFTQAAALKIAPGGQTVTGGIPFARVADFDSDGDPDIAIGTRYQVGLTILRNDGNFVFTQVFSAAFQEYELDAGVVTGDYDQDGDIDAGMFHYQSNGKRWLTWTANNGSGAFSAPKPVQLTNGEAYTASITGDFHNDGRMDLVTGDDHLTLVSGNAPGGTIPGQSLYIGIPAVRELAASDFDHDGNHDLLVKTAYFSTESPRLGFSRWNGTGFAAPVTIQTHATGLISGILATDVDGDGSTDAVFADSIENAILWSRNSGNGSFLIPRVLFAGQYSSRTLTGDVDGDGDDDIVWNEGDNEDILVSLNQAIHRTPEFTHFPALANLAGEIGICQADLNGDGNEDLIWSSGGAGYVSWCSGTTQYANGPGLGSGVLITNAVPGVSAITAGDLNHDGRPDVVMAAGGAGQIQIAFNQNPSWPVSYAAPMPAGTTYLAIADVDRDNNPDIIAGHASGVTLLRNTTGNGDAWVSETVSTSLKNVTCVRPWQFNGNGRLELAAITSETTPRRSRVYNLTWNSSTGNWNLSTAISDGDGASGILTTGDASKDGRPDLVFATSAVVSCAPNVNNASFGTFKAITGMPAGLRCAELGDFNRDGIPDLVAGGSGVVVLAAGKGDGTFMAAEQIFTNPLETYTRMALFDFEQDGDPDIALLEPVAGKFRILRNHCGQYDLTETTLSSGAIPAAGAALPVMHLTFDHTGRSGDAAINVRSLRFRLRKAVKGANDTWTMGDGLTSEEAASLISSIEVYRDSGEPLNFEPGIDTLAGSVGPATSIGYLTVTPSTNLQAQLIAGPGQSLRFHVRLMMNAALLSSPVRDFFVEHITDTTAGGTMVVHGGLTENFRLTPRSNTEAAARIHLPTELEAWRNGYWGTIESTGPAANDADPDHDGRPNLVEYVSGTNPLTGDPGSLISIQGSGEYRSLRLKLRSPAPADVKVSLEFSTTMTSGKWKSLSSRTGSGPWSGFPTMQTLGITAGQENLLTVDGPPVNTEPRGYYRLRAEELP